ncbi:putative reverse transcriptase, RNA-dependent DNA polymerase [Plasmopara halstedii]
MAPPLGINIPEGLVCKLRRSLYGLKQAAAVWYKKVRSVFISMEFVQCRADPCLFVRHQNGRNSSPVFIILYVDDLLIGCKSDEIADKIRDELAEHFVLNSLGEARYVLGMEIQYATEKGELSLRQSQFISKMLEKFGLSGCNPVRNPMVLGQDLTPDDSHSVHRNQTEYWELIGSLLYIVNATRPDISASLSTLSQFLEQPREMHWHAALRVLKYLSGTRSHGILFRRSARFSLQTFADANWGGDKGSRRSTSGVLLLLGGEPVVYKSKRQATVALSSAEAEYMALALATQEVIWLRYLLTEIGYKIGSASTIYLDNKSAISIATNQGYTPRANHIDLRAHFVRDQVEAGNIKLEHVPSAEQLADYLTKPVPTPQLVKLREVEGECRSSRRGFATLCMDRTLATRTVKYLHDEASSILEQLVG